ncbi:Serpentine Receptor, class I [Caenorhabditis elegans]|uniref:Serpentine Receptor, class I n=1 Tax=Caenorhabditis elegans TaxID=6239 RepID=Q9N549_CAEEL|nr:Serpentine Receptor, class I [Caenorhabditis elegans]CCD73682.1 Serpentine Receptor, class I [Caenorhabditis elegans]|eukprot:NP_001022421.1 Serpentine Receptor, class I [Caenorhabditis elegans]
MDITFELPVWLVWFYHCMGTISFLLNTFTIYLALFKSDTIDNFRYCILVFQLLCTLTDFYLTFLMQPIPLFPIIAGYCSGFLAVYLNASTHYLMAFMMASMSAQMEWLVYCFIKKHQTIGKILSTHIIPAKLFFVGEAGIPVLPVAVFVLYSMAGMDREEQLGYVLENYPQFFAGFTSLSNFAIYTLNFWFLLIAAVSLIGGLICGLVFTYSTLDMFKMLRSVQRRISTASYNRHEAAVKSLLAQFSVTSLCVGPPVMFVVVVMSKFRYAQVTVQLLLAIFASHSSVNALVLVATTPPFRNFVLRKPPKRIFALNISTVL